nr:MAG TPA: hypothetical protein [Caudoviricetes sp.]
MLFLVYFFIIVSNIFMGVAFLFTTFRYKL